MNGPVDSMYSHSVLHEEFLENRGCAILNATFSPTISPLIPNLAFSCALQNYIVIWKKQGAEECVVAHDYF